MAPLACTLAQGLGFRLGDLLQKVQRNRLGDLDVIGGLLSPACYIDQSFPAVLYLAARYAGVNASTIARYGTAPVLAPEPAAPSGVGGIPRPGPARGHILR